MYEIQYSGWPSGHDTMGGGARPLQQYTPTILESFFFATNVMMIMHRKLLPQS